jgi:glycosyltransferase 2 family protein
MRIWLIRLLNFALFAASVGYLVFVLADIDIDHLLVHLSPGNLAVALAVALANGLAFYLLAYSWSRTLQHLAARPVCLTRSMRLYAVSTLAKYLPGNIFHYAGRQIAVARLGYGQKAAAQATAVEIAGHLFAAGLLLVLLWPFASDGLGWLSELQRETLGLWPLALVGLAGLLGFAGVLLARRGHRLWPGLDRRSLLRIAVLQVIFFALATLLGVWLAVAVLGVPPAKMPAIAFAYILAWLVGFLTPGAPGGLGVREACLVAALSAYGDTSAILAFAALTRIALLIGECLFALSGFLMEPRSSQSLRRPAH